MFNLIKNAIVAALGGSLTRLGLGIMTGAAGAAVLHELIDTVAAQIGGLPLDALRFIGASGATEALSIIASAKLTKVAMSSIKVVKK